MTLKVTISHEQPGYDKSAQVEVGYLDEKGIWNPGSEYDTKVIQPGQSAEFYVYGGRELRVIEVPNP